MKPVFIDFHIHTSDNPECLNDSYNVGALKAGIEKIADGAEYLISITDHNVINKSAYLEAATKIDNLLLGVELHVRNYDNAKPYHCHILFNISQINEETIDVINSKLDELYPKKVVSNTDKSIPKLEEITNKFDDYEFLLLPHGGQNHSTFDKSIPEGAQFDKTLQRNIYYNHFDGFTARSNTSLDKTHNYFERLGIKEFVNLVTATDNYEPEKYPDCKAGREASGFTPTWMLASPTFNGLRLSLSESSRLEYGIKPDTWAECIQNVSLKNECIDIDVNLTPGLNVVIGGSSSGKTLFIDSVYRKIVGSLNDSVYQNTDYGINDIQVTNPAGQHPHYLPQNYIIKICDQKDKDNSIDDITILRSVFPADEAEREEITNGLTGLGTHLAQLVQAVKDIEALQDNLSRLPRLSHLIVTDVIQGNPIKSLLPEDQTVELMGYSSARHDRHNKSLNEIDAFLENNPLIDHDKNLIRKLREELAQALEFSMFEENIRTIILAQEQAIDDAQEAENLEITTKRQQFEELIDSIKKYIRASRRFYGSLDAISEYSIKISTKEIESMGHKLFIDNEFELTKEKFIEVVNSALKKNFAISSFDSITPKSLFKSGFKGQKPKIPDYPAFENHINSIFAKLNKKKYRITTKEGKDFETLGPGWKTSVILDLILGWGSDNAPLIIDQPEDNLATGYINSGLVAAIKRCKMKKQIILVSHNATIPMLGDAQNVVMCNNNDKMIMIRANPLEGSIGGINVVDLVAETTDGGKISVKKRVKKYNLKDFRGAHETSI